ncbi:FAD-linked oxidase C-terminal domain-containing protein [Methylobacterium oryzae CBMB20]
MDGYVRGALDRLAAIPGCRAVVYGHIGDNNLHWNTTRLDAAGNAAIDAAIYEPLAALNGLRLGGARDRAREARQAEAVALARGDRHRCGLVKRALDPDNRLNPGKIF